MKSLKDIQKIITEFNIKPRPEMRSKVLDEALKIQRNRKQQNTSDAYIWRIIMKSRIVKLAAAAVIILIAVLAFTLLDKSVTPAYAIEQTIEEESFFTYCRRQWRFIYYRRLGPRDPTTSST